MRAPTGNSQDRSSQSKPTAGGETNRRRKPVAGSTHSRCSLRLTSAGASPSMSASRRETVVRCAPASRPSTDAVGLTSPFSIRDREARLTPLSAESSSSDQPRARRNARRRSARRISASSRVWTSCSILGRILSETRASSQPPGGLESRIACEAVLLQTPTSPQRNGSMPPPHHASIPAWAWAVPLLASALVALKLAHIVSSDDTYVLVLAGLFLCDGVRRRPSRRGLALKL